MKVVVRKCRDTFDKIQYKYEAIDRLRAVKDIINDRIIECVAYPDMCRRTREYWASEIAARLKQIDTFTDCTILKRRDYLEYLFGPFGDAKDDAEWNLSNYKFRNERRPEHEQYPDFEITDELVDKLYETYQAIMSASLPLLVSKTKHSMTEWTSLISPILI